MAEPAPEQHYYTREEYLAREEIAEYKSKYYDGEIVAMAGGTYNHSRICCYLINITEP
jgi:Uma2 family endonuclease